MNLSRRDVARLLAVGAAVSTFPKLVAQPAQRSRGGGVRLSANENPYGPSANALAAMRDALDTGFRYPDEATDELISTVAKLHGVDPSQVILGDGSSEILKLTAAAFCSPARKMVMADPTFEAIGAYARAAGAEVVKIPLTASYEHDLTKMAAVANAGAVYICNPNNPTASITPKAAIRKFIEALPQDTVVLVDEAYHHYADSPDYESVIPLVQSRPNLIVARTFSKIYAMAGIRCGYGIAQKSVIQRMDQQKAWDSMNVVALAGARVSLGDTQHVIDGRQRNSETRNHIVNMLTNGGYEVVPSQANFFMVNIKRDVRPVIQSLRGQGVHVGRLFPAMPTYLRVTVGKPEEMQAFASAFHSVMA